MAISFNSQEAAWSDVSVTMFGTQIQGARSVKYKKTTEKEAIYGAGSEPLTIQNGNTSYSGSLGVLKNALDQLNAAAVTAGYTDLQSVPSQAVVVTVTYKEGYSRPKVTKVLSGVSFTEMEEGLKTGDKMMEIELPFVFLGLETK